jgi:hypothetical protein
MRQERKRGRFPIPTFSHREPPFCVAAEAYLFLAPFLAAAFFAPPLAAFFAPPFFAVAISLLLLSSKFLPYTQDTVAWLLLCTSLNDTQDIVVYIGFRFSCQRFFLSTGKINQHYPSVPLKQASRACFVFSPSLRIVYKVFHAKEEMRNRFSVFVFCRRSEKGSGSQFQGARLETGSGGLF